MLTHLMSAAFSNTSDSGKSGITTRQIQHMLAIEKAHGRLPELIQEMLKLVGLEKLLPPIYSRFTPVAVEGMAFILSEISLKRLSQKIMAQARLPRDVSLGHRLCELILDMPSLQKMGQILCRHPELDAEFRQALVELEDSLKNLSFDRLQPKLKQALLGMDSDHGIEAENKILAEASVCAVVPGKAAGSASGKTQSVVLKLVKPGIQENLARELSLLDRLAFYLAERQQDWGLENFQFQDTFRQVRWLLENEIDLTREQNNIRTAFGYYAAKSDVVIPELFSCSTPTMTVMSRVSGYKITAVNHLTDQQRRLLAQTLAKACILDPIQELRPTSIFHGDPHAGNIAYCFEGRHPQLIFYDWGMMGRLSRNERFDFSMLALGFLLKSVDIILHATNNITHGQVSCHEKQEAVIHRAINKVIASHGGNPTAVLGAIEKLFEELAYKGIVFSSNLFMYEKAQVTLKGIFAEIDPEFKMDAYLAWVSVGKFLSDIAHLRYHLVALEEAWRLYMRYFKQMMDLQKQLAGYMLKSG